MHRRAVIANLKFHYSHDQRALKGKLKYFQHRDDKQGQSHVAQVDEYGKRIPRWIDRGLGGQYEPILQSCADFQTQDLKNNVLARLLVIAPEVHFMEAIDPQRRADVMRELTSETVENWFERLNLPTPEYAFVVHESRPSDKRPDGQDKDERRLSESYVHSHVVLAATVTGLEKPRESYRIYERHVRQLHEAGREAMEQIWTREVGAERLAELDAELEARTQHYLALDSKQAGKAIAIEEDMPEVRQESPLAALDEGLELD